MYQVMKIHTCSLFSFVLTCLLLWRNIPVWHVYKENSFVEYYCPWVVDCYVLGVQEGCIYFENEINMMSPTVRCIQQSDMTPGCYIMSDLAPVVISRHDFDSRVFLTNVLFLMANVIVFIAFIGTFVPWNRCEKERNPKRNIDNVVLVNDGNSCDSYPEEGSMKGSEICSEDEGQVEGFVSSNALYELYVSMPSN